MHTYAKNAVIRIQTDLGIEYSAFKIVDCYFWQRFAILCNLKSAETPIEPCSQAYVPYTTFKFPSRKAYHSPPQLPPWCTLVPKKVATDEVDSVGNDFETKEDDIAPQMDVSDNDVTLNKWNNVVSKFASESELGFDELSDLMFVSKLLSEKLFEKFCTLNGKQRVFCLLDLFFFHIVFSCIVQSLRFSI